jgi:Domain of unknown function (DUF4342)/zinc-ribbon domain
VLSLGFKKEGGLGWHLYFTRVTISSRPSPILYKLLAKSAQYFVARLSYYISEFRKTLQYSVLSANQKTYKARPTTSTQEIKPLPFCSKCGKEISSDMKFCQNCGTPVGIEEESFSVSSEDLVQKVKELVHEGNVKRIIINSEEGKTLLDIPVTVGVIGLVLVPWLAAIGAIAALATNCTIVVQRQKTT